MDLENFPTSESAKRMLEYVDSGGFYDESYVGKWIFQVMGMEMDEARAYIEELPYQAFPETATWGLRYHEQKYGLPVRENLPYEERRRYIYSKRDERLPMNPFRMEVILENLTGRKVHVDDESSPVNTFRVELEPGDNIVDVAAAIKKLKEIKQSHVAFTFCFTSLARIELCGNVRRYKAQYTSCGTVPMISRALRMTETELEIAPDMEVYKKVSPMSGNSGEAGQYPKVSAGLKISSGIVETAANTVGYHVDYPEASENMKTGTHPGTESAVVYAATSVETEAVGIGQKFRNRVSGTEPTVSVRMAQTMTGAELETSAEGVKVQYPTAGEKPQLSNGMIESGKSVIPEVTTESYQVRYKLCGDAFEL